MTRNQMIYWNGNATRVLWLYIANLERETMQRPRHWSHRKAKSSRINRLMRFSKNV